MRLERKRKGEVVGELRTLCAEGDLRLRWDPKAPEQVAKARAEFDRLKKAGYLLFKVKPFSRKPGAEVKEFGKTDGQLIADFAPGAEGIVAAPPVRGG